MKNFLRFLVTLTVLALGSVTQASERGDWKEALRLDKSFAYEKFISSHPESKHISEARQRLEESRRREEAAKWEELRGTNQRWRLEEFIKKNPASPYIGQAQERLAAMDYESAVSSNTLERYEKFLREHPQSAQATEAREAIARLRAQADEAAFARAKNTGRYFDILAYSQNFPSGTHAGEIATLLASYKWTKLKKTKTVPWESLDTSLLDAAALEARMKKEIKFDLISSIALKGSSVQPLDDILFVAKGAAIPFMDNSTVEVTSFRIDAGNEYSRLSTPGPDNHLRSVFPLILVSVGSSIAIGHGEPSGEEARATSASSNIGGSSFSMAKDPNAVPGVINVWGIPCRGGSLRVVDTGLELQPGTEMLVTP